MSRLRVQGQSGSQTSVTPNLAAANVIGINFGEFHLRLTDAAKSINASVWVLAATSAPEPTSLFMLTASIAGLLGVRCRLTDRAPSR
ncbi:MAG: PEP-CTERM sorting domain-containing protein [Janthinobacterium lividum]